MQTSSDLLMNVERGGIRFIRDGFHRMLHVIVPPWMKASALDLVAGLSPWPEAEGPLLVLDGEQEEDVEPWMMRARQLRERYTAWQGEQTGVAAPWPSLPDAPPGEGLVGFAEQLGQLVLIRPCADAEILVALVPDPSSEASNWATLTTLLVNSPPLRSVRWALIDVGVGSLDAEAVVGGPVVVVQPEVDGVEPPRGTGPGSSDASLGSGARSAGLVSPPRSRGKTSSADPSADPPADRSALVAGHALAGSEAISEGQPGAAIEQQCSARDRAAEGDSLPQTVAMEIVLGGHLLAAGTVTQALSSHERAVAMAKDAGDSQLSAVALLALGSSQLTKGDKPAALVTFADAATHADDAGSSMLTVEACRLTGDLALELGMEGQAVAFWSRAIKCGRGDPATESSSSVARCVRSLEGLCEDRGLEAPREQASPAEPAESTGAELLREWTPKEQEILARCTRSVIDDEATSLLTPEEIASIHDWGKLPPPRDLLSQTVVFASSTNPVGSDDLLRGDTEWLDPDELQRLREGLVRK